MYLRRLATSLPVQLIAIILLVALCGSMVPTWYVQFFYTISTILRESLSLLLPFIIFFFVTSGIIALRQNAPKILLVLLACVFISNATIAFLVFGIGRVTLPYVVSHLCVEGLSCAQPVTSFFSLGLPQYIEAKHALLGAIGVGIALSYYPWAMAEQCVLRGKKILEAFFVRCFIPLLPLYVLGFLLQIQREEVLVKLVTYYGSAFFLILTLQAIFLVGYYWIAQAGHIKRTIQALKNALPSYLTAFSTMSSTVAVPVTIKGAIANTRNSALANMAMPIMANIHLVGDSIGTPILALVTILLFLGTFPSLVTYAYFVFYFCTAMFAVSGVPGGGILVMIPVLKAYLGFTQEMIGIIMTLYILLDAFGTAANVMGDGALVILLNKLLKKLNLQKV